MVKIKKMLCCLRECPEHSALWRSWLRCYSWKKPTLSILFLFSHTALIVTIFLAPKTFYNYLTWCQLSYCKLHTKQCLLNYFHHLHEQIDQTITTYCQKEYLGVCASDNCFYLFVKHIHNLQIVLLYDQKTYKNPNLIKITQKYVNRNFGIFSLS